MLFESDGGKTGHFSKWLRIGITSADLICHPINTSVHYDRGYQPIQQKQTQTKAWIWSDFIKKKKKKERKKKTALPTIFSNGNFTHLFGLGYKGFIAFMVAPTAFELLSTLIKIKPFFLRELNTHNCRVACSEHLYYSCACRKLLL